LEREVGLLIVCVGCWPGQGRLQAGEVTELVAGLRVGTPEDFGVQTDNVLGFKVYGLLLRVGQALTSAVVRLEDAKRLEVLADHFPADSPNPSADLIGWSDEELTGRKLLHQDFAIRAVSEALDPVRKCHHVAVAHSPNLHDLHRRQYTRVYTSCQVLTRPDDQGLV
jgi:hypothetical protein